MNWPSLSIVIPALNQGTYIERALLSVFKQRYRGELQVIVADGGSTDATVEILKKFPHLTWWSKPDNGVLDAIFRALEVATGEIITTLPADDFYLKGAFSKTIPLLVENPAFDFVAGAFAILKAHDVDLVLPDKQSRRISSPLEYITGEVSIPLQAAFIRRSAYDRVGGFRPEAEQCCDADFLYRMLHFSQGLVIPEYISVFQLQANQKTRLNPEQWITSLKFMIEDCERDERYSGVFKLSEALKREADLRNQIFWNDNAGGCEGRQKALSIAGDILAQHHVFSKELVAYAHSFVGFPRQTRMRRMALSIADGSIVHKIKACVSRTIDKHCIDVNWWRA